MKFETALNELESLIEKMESGELTLEESLNFFEKGVKLSASCQEFLKKAEHKIQLLTEQNGEVKAQAFEKEAKEAVTDTAE